MARYAVTVTVLPGPPPGPGGHVALGALPGRPAKALKHQASKTFRSQLMSLTEIPFPLLVSAPPCRDVKAGTLAGLCAAHATHARRRPD
jgi:hypothetical protein